MRALSRSTYLPSALSELMSVGKQHCESSEKSRATVKQLSSHPRLTMLEQLVPGMLIVPRVCDSADHHTSLADECVHHVSVECRGRRSEQSGGEPVSVISKSQSQQIRGLD